MRLSKTEFKREILAYIPEFRKKEDHRRALANANWKSKRRTKPVGPTVRLPKPESDDATSDFLAVLNNED